MINKEEQKNKRLLQTYGITLEEWKQKLKDQNGTCWICKKMPKSGILCVDHRHIKGFKKLTLDERKLEVRGLLCFMCNTGLHGIEKRKNARFLLERIVLYFNKFKIKGDV